MTNCDKFVPLYTEYLDGTLSESSRSEFDQHLQKCSECAATLQHMKSLTAQLRQLSPVRTSNAFHIILRSRIRQELEKETVVERIVNLFRVYRWPAFATGIAALLLIFFSYRTLFQTETIPEPNQPLAVQKEQPARFSPKLPGHPQPVEDVYFVIDKFQIEDLLPPGEEINSENLGRSREPGSSLFDSLQQEGQIPVQAFRFNASISF